MTLAEPQTPPEGGESVVVDPGKVREQYTTTDLAALLAKWQKLLRLQDWNITAGFYHAYELARDGRAAENRHAFTEKVSEIRIVRPEEHNPGWCPATLDIEHSLVHELLHLHLSRSYEQVSRDDALQDELELAINMIADTLLRIDRR